MSVATLADVEGKSLQDTAKSCSGFSKIPLAILNANTEELQAFRTALNTQLCQQGFQAANRIEGMACGGMD
jgi:argonaute-like protein implicated in RNA metabolism and viral defense